VAGQSPDHYVEKTSYAGADQKKENADQPGLKIHMGIMRFAISMSQRLI